MISDRDYSLRLHVLQSAAQMQCTAWYDASFSENTMLNFFGNWRQKQCSIYANLWMLVQCDLEMPFLCSPC